MGDAKRPGADASDAMARDRRSFIRRTTAAGLALASGSAALSQARGSGRPVRATSPATPVDDSEGGQGSRCGGRSRS